MGHPGTCGAAKRSLVARTGFCDGVKQNTCGVASEYNAEMVFRVRLTGRTA